MEALLKQLANGEFKQGQYTLVLRSGTEIWTANGYAFLRFYPESGDRFTFWEKWKIAKAIKQGRIKQAIAPQSISMV